MKQLSEQELKEGLRALHRALTCPVCGQPKVHYRLYGYRCHNPEHAEMEARGEYGQQDTFDTAYTDAAQLAAYREMRDRQE